MPEYPYTSYARKLNQIVDDTLRICLDFRGVGQNGYALAREEIMPAVKWAIVELVRRTGCLREFAIIPLKESVGVYDLPPNLFRLTRVGMHNLSGYVILPTSITQVDMYGGAFEPEGDPVKFYREMLDDDQIGLLPVPHQDGSTFVPAGDLPYGGIRELVDSDGNELPVTGAPRGLGRISGVPFRRRGRGRGLKEVISPYGNVTVHYVRKPDNDGKYPDTGIPEWVHKDLKYGAAIRVLRYTRDNRLRMLAARYEYKFNTIIGRLRKRTTYHGPMGHHMRPL